MRIELLINARSRNGRIASNTLVDILQSVGIKVDKVHKLTDISRLGAVLAGVRRRSPDVLITASGDGTVSDVVDYLAGTSIKLGFVPLGTTNNFARSLGVPLDIEAAVQVIADGKTRHIALGQVEEDYFANVAGVGISADIARRVTSKRKQRYGRLAYLITACQVLVSHRPFFVQVTDKDGELEAHFETHQVVVANGRYHAGTEIAEGADLGRPQLVVFKLGGPSRLSLLWHMIDFYFGKRRTIYHSSYFIGRDFRIRTGSPQPIELDGEVKLRTPVSARVRPSAIQVFCQ